MIESGNTKILLDSGVKIGDPIAYPTIEKHELKDVDGIVVTHAHLDHIGFLPHIYSGGWEGPTYLTKPTFELGNVIISDYLKISNPKDVTRDGVLKMQRNSKMAEFNEEFRIKDLTVKLQKAGHILGSSIIEVSDGRESLIYTGDINFGMSKILDPAPRENLHARTLITESTYGGDNDIFPTEKKITTDMVSSIKETVKQGGKVIIPSFGVGRSQEIMLTLDDYMHSGSLPHIPIYTDGMINKALRIHRHNVIYCREELQKRILMSEDDPFKSKNFFDVTSNQMRRKIMNSQESCIIVTTSGMLNGGPVLRYLERLGRYTENKMMLVGYQVEGTRGRDLQDGKKELDINGRKVPVNLEVETYHLSAHADRQQLERFVESINGLENIFIVHGEPAKSRQFNDALKEKYKTHLPRIGEQFTL